MIRPSVTTLRLASRPKYVRMAVAPKLPTAVEADKDRKK